jgi:hypothetical protein
MNGNVDIVTNYIQIIQESKPLITSEQYYSKKYLQETSYGCEQTDSNRVCHEGRLILQGHDKFHMRDRVVSYWHVDCIDMTRCSLGHPYMACSRPLRRSSSHRLTQNVHRNYHNYSKCDSCTV